VSYPEVRSSEEYLGESVDHSNHKIGVNPMKLQSTVRLLAVAFTAISAALPLSSACADDFHAKPKIGLVMKSLANEFFVTMQEGAKDYQKCHAADFDMITNGIKNETDTSAQIDIVNQMILARVNAIVIAPADSKSMASALKKASNSGIKIVNIDNRLDPGVLKSKNLDIPFVGPDNRKGARMVGDYLSKYLAAGDKVGIIEGVPTTTNAQDRTAGFKEAMDAAGMKIVSTQSGNWEIDQGQKVAAAMLSEYPDLKALLAGNDNMALGAVSAVRAAGKSGNILVVGYDNIEAIKPMLQDGRILATASQAAAQQAVFGVQSAIKLVKGERVETKDGVIETPVELVLKIANSKYSKLTALTEFYGPMYAHHHHHLSRFHQYKQQRLKRILAEIQRKERVRVERNKAAEAKKAQDAAQKSNEWWKFLTLNMVRCAGSYDHVTS